MATSTARKILACGGLLICLSCAGAQEEKREPVLPYVPASRGAKAHVEFVPPRGGERARTFRLRTPRGTISVRCDASHTANPPRAWASEISYPLTESLFHFRGPASLPVHLSYRGYYGYGGYMVGGGRTVHEVRVNGKTQPNEDKTHCAPIILTGGRNTLSISLCDSGGE